MQILTVPKNALMKQYQRLFEMEDVRLTHHPGGAQGDRPQGHRAQDRAGACARSWRHPARHHVRAAGLKGVEEVVIGRRLWRVARAPCASTPTASAKRARAPETARRGALERGLLREICGKGGPLDAELGSNHFYAMVTAD
jgi:hypothetical protein